MMVLHLALLASALTLAEGDSTRAVQAHRIAAAQGEPTIDGRLDEPAWEAAEVATGFVQLRPRSGAAASQRTEARVLYGEDAIYVGMRMYDSAPDSIAAQLARRDARNLYSDWAHVGIDSYNDNRSAFRFSVNPRGVKADAYLFDDAAEDWGWDAVWQVATQVDSLGWTAEFRIPLSQLRFESRGSREQVWGINFGREIARHQEQSYWSPLEPNTGRVVSAFGELHGLRGLSARSRLELQPYSLGRVTRAPGEREDPFFRSNATASSFGADLKYGLTSNLTLTATFNPDFGQVEADPSVVNLSAYETFLPEQRPFFVEGTDIFRFGIGVGDGDLGNEQLFYSRRVGRQPQRSVDAGGGYLQAADATTILGAAKLSGKLSNGWSVGLLNAVTSREETRYLRPGQSAVESATSEPWTNYAVARAIRSADGGRSAVGGILTATHRRLEGGLEFLPSSSYAGGLDLRHRFGGGRYEVRSSVLGSLVEGDTAAIHRLQRSAVRRFQRPDADHVAYDPTRTSLGGWAASTEVMKIGGGNWRYGGFLNVRSPGFEVNDLGYQREADLALQVLWAQYQSNRPGRVFRSWRIGVNEWAGWTLGGERAATGGNLNGNFQLKSFWGGYGGLNREASSLAVAALRGGPAIVRPGNTNTWFGMHTDRRRPASLSLDGNASREDETGGYSWRLGPSVDVRPSTSASLSLRPSYSRSAQAWQFVGSEPLDGTPRYLFGRLDQTTTSVTARLNYTFTPALSLQLYAQPFISAGRYSDFRAVADPRAERFADRLPLFAATRAELGRDASGRFRADTDGDGTPDVRFRDPDFNVKQFRSNAVLRWEYRPGSTLFVVWSQGRSDRLPDGTFGMRRDFGRLFGLDDEHGVAATNTLLIKLNYWLNL
jgi:hypothetical protein